MLETAVICFSIFVDWRDGVDINELVEHQLAKGVGERRAVKYIYHPIVLARMVGKPFDHLDTRNVEDLVSQTNASDYAGHTGHDYRMILKKLNQ